MENLEEITGRINAQFASILEQITEVNTRLYRENIALMSDNELYEEYKYRIGDELSDYDRLLRDKGRSHIEWVLTDAYNASQFDKYLK